MTRTTIQEPQHFENGNLFVGVEIKMSVNKANHIHEVCLVVKW